MFDFSKLFILVSDATIWNLAMGIFLGIMMAVVFVGLAFLVFKGAVAVGKGVRKGSKKVFKTPRQKCASVQCPFCGKTLDKCVCTKNQDRSYSKRYRVYKKWKKANKKKSSSK
jgi:hypothetical protein